VDIVLLGIYVKRLKRVRIAGFPIVLIISAAYCVELGYPATAESED
jgi:hypothetical protein